MALFGTQRDAKFLASINAEFFDSILIPALITKETKTANMDDYGHDYTRTAQFGISRDILEKANFYPEVGDIVLWDNEYYELDNVDANQYFAGKNPDTWPNGSSFGYSVSVLCDSHVTRQRPLNIRKMNFGVTDDNQSYEGFN